MKPTRKLSRRSFLRQVGGTAFVGGAGIGLFGASGAHAHQTGPYTGVTDTDSGSYADNAGHGRGPGGNRSGQPAQPQPGQTGYSDSDSGANADPSGAGRRGPQSGVTDSDPTDASGAGRGTGRRPDRSGRYTGITDSDNGATRDRGGYGIGDVHRDADHQDQGVIITRPRSVCTDADGAPNRDPVGQGRRCR